MGIRFACHLCDHKLNIKSDLAGRRGICPACSGRFRIPLEDAEKSSPLEVKPAAPQQAPESQVTKPPAATDGEHAPEPSSQPLPETAEPKTILDDDDEGIWYVRPPSGGQYGPASTDLLKQWIAEGRVAATSLLWRDGWPQWRDASEALPELVEQLPTGESPDTQPDQPADAPVDSKATALTGNANVGTNRRKRSNRRVTTIGILIALIGVLVAGLIYAVNR